MRYSFLVISHYHYQFALYQKLHGVIRAEILHAHLTHSNPWDIIIERQDRNALRLEWTTVKQPLPDQSSFLEFCRSSSADENAHISVIESADAIVESLPFCSRSIVMSSSSSSC